MRGVRGSTIQLNEGITPRLTGFGEKTNNNAGKNRVFGPEKETSLLQPGFEQAEGD